MSGIQEPSDTLPMIIGSKAYVPHGSSLSRVPSEIWTHIFTLVDDPPRVVTARSNLPAVFWLGWIQLTHVCQYWRCLVLDNPAFWARIIFCLGTRWMFECFHRSGSALLTVDMDTRQMPMALFDVPLDLYRHRLRRLSLATVQRPNTGTNGFLSFLAEGVPHLESLQIHSSSIDGDPILPSSSSASPFSNLRHLVITGVQLPWTSFPFHNLTTFAVTLPSIQSWRITVSTFVNTLEHMPELKTLHIAGGPGSSFQQDLFSQHPSSSIGPLGRIVSLARLEKLTLMGSSVDAIQLRRALKIPSSAQCRFLIENSHDYELSSFVNSLSTSSSPSYGAPPVLRAVSIDACGAGTICLTADAEEFTTESRVFSTVYHSSLIDAYSQLAPLCKGIFAGIVDLHLKNIFISDKQQWQGVLEPLSLLQTLSYESDSPHIKQLLEALYVRQDSTDDPQSTMLLLPALQTLHLDCPTHWTSRFTACIQHRQRSRAPLATLQLSNFVIAENDVALLGSCVPNLRVLD